MRAPSEAHVNQLVEIQRGQRLATSPEQNLTYGKATTCAKLRGWMYQAVTKVNVLSPVITHVVEVDAVHDDRRQYCCDVKGENTAALPGSEAMA